MLVNSRRGVWYVCSALRNVVWCALECCVVSLGTRAQVRSAILGSAAQVLILSGSSVVFFDELESCQILAWDTRDGNSTNKTADFVLSS